MAGPSRPTPTTGLSASDAIVRGGAASAGATRGETGLDLATDLDLVDVEGGAADVFLVADRLGEQIEVVGGREYIAALYDSSSSGASAGPSTVPSPKLDEISESDWVRSARLVRLAT